MSREHPQQSTTPATNGPQGAEAVALCRALVEGTRDDVVIADGDGVITYISRRLAEAAGSDPGDLVGEMADRALGVMELPSFSSLRSMLATVSSARTEAELVDAGNRRQPVLLRGVSLEEPGGEQRYVWFVTPLDRVRTYERANRMLRSELETQSRLLALVSHELRTPLNVILAQLSILEAGLRGEMTEEQLDCVERASRAGHGLLSQVNDIIDFARLEGQDVEIRPEALRPRRLEDAVRTVAKSVLPNSGAGLTMENHLPGDSAVRADPERTRKILEKLLSNAVKHGSGGGGVRVELGIVDAAGDAPGGGEGVEPRVVGVDVCDSGAGIPGPERQRVFEPFQQTEDLLRRSQEGGGLGLAIARRLARLQGGDLVVHRASSRGSVFRLCLPLGE